jgi:hypothetical protein
MTDQNPKSPIVLLDNDFEFHFPYSPSLQASILSPNIGNGNSGCPAGFGELEPQYNDPKPESHKSCIKETQFVPLEPGTQPPERYDSCIEETQFVTIEKYPQALNEVNFSDSHQDSDFQLASIQNTSFNTAIQVAPLISRPDLGDIDDIANGFIFKQFEKPAKGKFNRPQPPVPAASQLMTEKSSKEYQSQGTFHNELR